MVGPQVFSLFLPIFFLPRPLILEYMLLFFCMAPGYERKLFYLLIKITFSLFYCGVSTGEKLNSCAFSLLPSGHLLSYGLCQGVLAAIFDLAAFRQAMIAPFKKSVNHSKTVTSMREMRMIRAILSVATRLLKTNSYLANVYLLLVCFFLRQYEV